MIHDNDPFKELRPQEPTLPQPVEFLAFEKQPVEKPRPIIDGLLDNASRMFFAGGSKTYKTWAMADLALSIATGAPWLGFGTHQHSVLYVNFELKDYYLKYRMCSIRAARDLALRPNSIFVWNLRGYSVSLPAFKDQALQFIQTHAITTIFIDPFYKLLGCGDERVSAELVPILNAFDELNRLSGVSTVTAAHYSKGNQAGKDPMDRISGGGYIGRDPDGLITLTNHEEAGAFTLDFTVRDHEPVESFVVKWQVPLLVRTDLDPSRIKKPLGAPSQYRLEDILSLISDNNDQLTVGQLQRLSLDQGMSRATFYRLWAELREKKLVFVSRITKTVSLEK